MGSVPRPVLPGEVRGDRLRLRAHLHDPRKRVTHAIGSISRRRYNPGLYTSLALFFPWGIFLLIYFNRIVTSALLWNLCSLLVAIIGHAIIVVYAIRRRRRLEAGSLGGAEAGA